MTERLVALDKLPGGGKKIKKDQEKCWAMRRDCTSLVCMVDDMEERDARAEENIMC